MPMTNHYYSPFGRQHAKLHITHVPTGRWVAFDAYLEGFSDMYTSTWNGLVFQGANRPGPTVGVPKRGSAPVQVLCLWLGMCPLLRMKTLRKTCVNSIIS